MKFLKSHFRYNKSQRNGIFFLITVIIFLQFIFFFVDFSSDENIDFSTNEIIEFQAEMDSLKRIELENRKPKIYPFNPNFITDYKGFQLGMSNDEIDNLLLFRAKGKYVNSIHQFQEVTTVSDSLLNLISPYFKFPDWVKEPKSNSKNIKVVKRSIPILKKDLNLATIADLRIVNGIGEKLANRIVTYRTKLQGFSFNNQLYEVWNIDKEIIDKVLMYFEVFEKPVIKKLNINEASFKEVLSIVYIDYELTKKIFNYRDEVAEIQHIDELKKIEGFPLEKFDRIALYLRAE
ncbi:MAG: helix-hairpin-helix domain-containing protein [Lutibacter sp.]|uniref:ComEA family DNA-binding protein n=1 Tax=Lutibacter sp. TaxID=1925666 RepID=UPI001816C8C9|nr:helix-hairpin-helix domain-containing protein [Lutibacter sp.]MBT8316608.1 helix-hairpin-helix domain-containing protein [Lutibacter sp.]NNJ57468.1 helix-hairpin-helix domain-containing protein [Lutibacter sp.]